MESIVRRYNNLFEMCLSEIEDITIYEVGGKLGISFPQKYIDLVKLCDGAFPEKNVFGYFSNLLGTYDQSCLGMFHVYCENYPHKSELMISRIKNPPEFFPEGLISFASVGNGDLICFDYRADPKTDNPPIVIWEHEAAGSDDAVSPIAPDFESFMNMLMSDEEAEKEYARLTTGK